MSSSRSNNSSRSRSDPIRGRAVAGQESGGIVTYSYHGQSYSIDDTASFRTGSRTVWLDPQKPSAARLNSLTVARVSDSLFVGVPALAGAATIGVGFVKKQHRRRVSRNGSTGGGSGFGAGIDSDTIVGILADRRKL